MGIGGAVFSISQLTDDVRADSIGPMGKLNLSLSLLFSLSAFNHPARAVEVMAVSSIEE